MSIEWHSKVDQMQAISPNDPDPLFFLTVAHFAVGRPDRPVSILSARGALLTSIRRRETPRWVA